MTGYRPGLYWQMTWRYIGPAMMSVLLVASVISMLRTSPEYGAWNADLVTRKSILKLCKVITFIHPGEDRSNCISRLGHGDRFGNDLRWNSADALGLPPTALPDPQSRPRHPPGLDSSQRDDRLHQGNNRPGR